MSPGNSYVIVSLELDTAITAQLNAVDGTRPETRAALQLDANTP
jgi:hypothetical protein